MTALRYIASALVGVVAALAAAAAGMVWAANAVAHDEEVASGRWSP